MPFFHQRLLCSAIGSRRTRVQVLSTAAALPSSRLIAILCFSHSIRSVSQEHKDKIRRASLWCCWPLTPPRRRLLTGFLVVWVWANHNHSEGARPVEGAETSGRACGRQPARSTRLPHWHVALSLGYHALSHSLSQPSMGQQHHQPDSRSGNQLHP